MPRYRYMSYHPVRRWQLLDPTLPLIDPKWTWTVGGDGVMTAKIVVPEDSLARERLRVATEPKQAAIYVRNEAGEFPWGGVVITRDWDPNNGTLALGIMEWRAWLNYAALTPVVFGQDELYSWMNKDQIQIAREIVAAVIIGDEGAGSPDILFGTEPLSGKLRDLNVYGTQMKRAGALLSTMSNRDGGFEWTITIEPDPDDQMPQLYFRTYYPQMGSYIPGLAFRRTVNGGNLVSYGPIKEDASKQYDRFHATGAGQAPQTVYAADTRWDILEGNVLRFEGSMSFNDITDRSTLASHARAARRFYEPTINLVPVTLTLDRPDVDSYHVGDRGHYLIQDRWHDRDEPAVRIIQKTVDMSGAGSVNLVLDLSDTVLPEVDTGGSI